MKFERQTIRRTHEGRTFEFTALATPGAVLDISFQDIELPLSWWRKFRKLPPRMHTVALPTIRSTAGGIHVAVQYLHEIKTRNGGDL